MMILMVGWLGTFLYLLNHAYVSFSKNYNRHIYYCGNFIAAIFLVLSSISMSSFQAVIVNLFWALISVFVLFEIDFSRLVFSKKYFYIIVISFLLVLLLEFFLTGLINLKLLGWSSTFVFCASYLLFCVNKMRRLVYLLCNIYAAFTLLPQLWLDQNLPVFALEVVWGSISILGFYRKINEVHIID